MRGYNIVNIQIYKTAKYKKLIQLINHKKNITIKLLTLSINNDGN